MKIGMVTACYKPLINGVTRMVMLYKSEMEKLGHEVTVFTLGEPDPAGEEPGVVRSPAVPVGPGYYFTMRYTRHAQELLAEMDIIHCHHLFMSVELAHRYGRCPIVYTNHTRYDLYTGTYVPIPQPAADAVMRLLWPEFTRLADVVIVPTQSVRQIMEEFGVQVPLVVIENGVEIRPFQNPPNPYSKSSLGLPEEAILLVHTGRLAVEKNLELLLEQFAIAHAMLPQLHLMLIGSGALAGKLKAQAQQLGLQENVHFTGAVEYEEVANYLAAADLYVTASASEVHPLSLIEALAAGLPVAAAASPGIVDTVQHLQTGLLTPAAEKGLAAAILALALNPALRQQMGTRARQESNRYDIRRTVARTLALYEELLQTRPDLQRHKKHGRSLQNRERLQPLLNQLASLLRPPAAWEEIVAQLSLRRESNEQGQEEDELGKNER